MALTILTAAAAATIIGLVVLVALKGWAGRVSGLQRLSLCGMTAGLLWAAPGRFLGFTPGLGDALFLLSLAIYLVATYGPAIQTRARAEVADLIDPAQPDFWPNLAAKPRAQRLRPPSA